MNEPKSAQRALDTADEFLRPLLSREVFRKSKASSIIGVLTENDGHSHIDESHARSHVIDRALTLLTGIHTGYIDPFQHDAREAGNGDPALLDAKHRRTIYALLDLLSVEGIYPSLPPGVGIPLEKRIVTALPAGVVARPQHATSPDVSTRKDCEQLLAMIMSALDRILRDTRLGLQQHILNRCLPDIISGSAELAFNSETLDSVQKTQHESLFYHVINRSSTPTLLSTLSSFLQNNPTSWFRIQITSQLSHLSLRLDGVVQTVTFLASQMAPVLGYQDQGPGPEGPPITVQAIMQTSKVLSAVPATMAAETYFANISPKLLSLLDCDDTDLRKTAAYVIGSGILGKKAYGAPKAVGYEIFVRPLLDALNGVASPAVQKYLRRFRVDGSPDTAKVKAEGSEDTAISALTVITEPQLSLALSRLQSLAMLHPNPQLLRRLVLPTMSSLWGLFCYSKEHKQSFWGQTASSLLQAYFSVTANVTRYETLVQNLLWDGGNHGRWTFAPGEGGGISIRKTLKKDATNPAEYMSLIDHGDERIDDFLKLLACDPQGDEAIAHTFLFASSRWLLDDTKHVPETGAATFDPSLPSSDLQFMLRRLVSAKLTEKLLDKFKDTLSRQPARVLDVIQQLIESEYRRIQAQAPSPRPLLSQLSSIAHPNSGPSSREADLDTGESLSAACSLLSTILSSPSFTLNDKLRPALSDIRTKLDTILPKLPTSLVQAATTSSVLLEITLTAKGADGEAEGADSQSAAAAARADALFEQHNLHRQALSNLGSELLPVQVEGLSVLSRLITDGSPILDIPSTSNLLLSLITTSERPNTDDEFLYLNVIKYISLLASRHPHTVVKQLSEAYADQDEELALDRRLRIGEALLSTVEKLGKALVGETARTLGETMLAVAGRRGRKPKARKARKDIDAQRTPVPRSANEEDIDQEMKAEIDKLKQSQGIEDPDAEDPAVTAHSEAILQAWARGATKDEQPDDLRVRASALSILASAISKSIAGLGPALVSSAVEMSLSILKLESEPGCAIVRRAAVILLLDILRALDEAREARIDLGFGFLYTLDDNVSYNAERRGQHTIIGNVSTILRTLAYVESQEEDVIVRGHIRTAIESYEAWFEKSLLWGIGRGSEVAEEPRLTLGDQLAGLNINLSAGNRAQGGGRDSRSDAGISGPRIEEIE